LTENYHVGLILSFEVDHGYPSSRKNKPWRIILQIRNDIILILDAFEKKTNETPLKIIDNCKRRINKYESDGK
jgi:phage-related protein